MIAVGVTSSVDRAELAVIASDNSMVVLVPSFLLLTEKIERITAAACADTIVDKTLGIDAISVLLVLL